MAPCPLDRGCGGSCPSLPSSPSPPRRSSRETPLPTRSCRRAAPNSCSWICSRRSRPDSPAPSSSRPTSASRRFPVMGEQRSDFTSLISGTHTLRVAYAGPDKSSVALLGDAVGEPDVIRQRLRRVDLVQQRQRGHPRHLRPRGPACQEHQGAGRRAQDPRGGRSPSPRRRRTDDQVSVATDPTVAGRAAYELVLTPKQTARCSAGPDRGRRDRARGRCGCRCSPAGGTTRWPRSASPRSTSPPRPPRCSPSPRRRAPRSPR